MSQTFDEAALEAANNLRRELRRTATQRLAKYGAHRSLCHEAFMGGHAKGFEAGWLAAKGRPRVASEAEVKAMGRQVVCSVL